MTLRPALRRACAVTVTVAGMGLLAGSYLSLLAPAAAREKVAACRALLPELANRELDVASFETFTRPAPEIEVQDYTGQMRRLSSYRGKVVFLNFWASWCPPCRAEMDDIEGLQRALAEEDFVVLAISSDADWATVREFFPHGTNLTVLLDPPVDDADRLGGVTKAWGVPALPETFLIDRDGYIRYYIVNVRDWDSGVSVQCMRSLVDEESSLSWLRSWLWTMSQTSFAS
jgi:peroxiredoxin